jgi:hypothetical protein
MSMLDTSSSDTNLTGIAHHAHNPTEVETLELNTRTQRSTSTESSDGEHQPSHGANGTEELHSTDTVPDTRNPLSTGEPSNNAVLGLERLTMKPDSSSSENNPTGIAHHAHKPTEEETPELDTRTQESILIES